MECAADVAVVLDERRPAFQISRRMQEHTSSAGKKMFVAGQNFILVVYPVMLYRNSRRIRSVNT